MEIVEVRGPDGKIHRFAGGTKAGFAVDRINACSIDQGLGRVVCIEAIRRGGDQEEDVSVAFGPDVDLRAHHGHGWTLQTVVETDKDELPNGKPPVEKVDLRTLFPGGKIPRGRGHDAEFTFEYFCKVILCFVFMLVFGMIFKAFLEQLPAICDNLLQQLPFIRNYFHHVTNDTYEL